MNRKSALKPLPLGPRLPAPGQAPGPAEPADPESARTLPRPPPAEPDPAPIPEEEGT